MDNRKNQRMGSGKRGVRRSFLASLIRQTYTLGHVMRYNYLEKDNMQGRQHG